jgi:hypothetical protein
MLKRNIKFPLVMKDEVHVRTLEELKDKFDLMSIIQYFLDGRLKTWLEQRYYKKELEALVRLSLTDNKQNIPKRISEIFGQEYHNDFDFEKYLIDRDRRDKILKHINSEEVLANINLDLVAFNQQDLDLILSTITQQHNKVFLIGKEFSVSEHPCNIHYVGLNKPIVKLICDERFDAKKNNIDFSNAILMSEKLIRFLPKTIDQCSIGSGIVEENKIIIEDLIKMSLVEMKKKLEYYPEEERKEIIVEVMKKRSSEETNVINPFLF